MRPDKAAEQRFAAWQAKVDAELALEPIVLAGMDLWRTAVLDAIVGGTPDREQILAGGFFQNLWRLDNAAAAARTWMRWVDGAVAPSISAVFGEAFNRVRKTATISAQPYEAEHMAEVHDRLKIWPAEAFEEIRPELQEALSEAESIDAVQDRVGAVLGIDQVSREHRARINEINRILDDPDADPADRADLLAEKAQAWRDHDASLQDWEWKARRIARTEIQGAVEAGQYEAARASESQLGITLWKRWLATPDSRVRAAHILADGQIVKLAERFTVGDAQLLFPADPSCGIAHAIINCRCGTIYQEYDEVQAELQGPDGSIGEIVPQGVRLGPDDPAVVAAKIDALKAADDQHDDTRTEDWAPPLIPPTEPPSPAEDLTAGDGPWPSRAFGAVEIVAPDHEIEQPRPHPAGARTFEEAERYLAPDDEPALHCKTEDEKSLLSDLRQAKPFVSVEPFGNTKTADFALRDERILVEAKTMHPNDPQRAANMGTPFSIGSVKQAIVRASKQARQVVIDGRVLDCVSPETARAAVAAVLASRSAAYLDEITVVTPSLVVYWRREH